MDILKVIENYIPVCSGVDRKISEFLLSSTGRASETSIYELAEILGVSTASISRYAKKLGLRSFAELKKNLIRMKTLQEKRQLGTVEDKLGWDNDYHGMQISIISTITEVCSDVFKINDIRTFEAAIALIEKSRTVYFVALGSSILAAKDLQHKLMRLRKQCIFIDDADYGLQNVLVATEGDVIVASSFDGATAKVLGAVTASRRKGVKVIGITRYRDNPLTNLSDISLYVPNIAASDSNLSSIFRRYGQMTVVDLIYIGLAKKLYKNPEESIEQYNEEVREINRLASVR